MRFPGGPNIGGASGAACRESPASVCRAQSRCPRGVWVGEGVAPAGGQTGPVARSCVAPDSRLLPAQFQDGCTEEDFQDKGSAGGPGARGGQLPASPDREPPLHPHGMGSSSWPPQEMDLLGLAHQEETSSQGWCRAERDDIQAEMEVAQVQSGQAGHSPREEPGKAALGLLLLEGQPSAQPRGPAGGIPRAGAGGSLPQQLNWCRRGEQPLPGGSLQHRGRVLLHCR